MKLSKDVVLEYMQKQVLATQEEVHFTTQQLSEALQMQRSNLSKLLNELAKETSYLVISLPLLHLTSST